MMHLHLPFFTVLLLGAGLLTAVPPSEAGPDFAP